MYKQMLHYLLVKSYNLDEIYIKDAKKIYINIIELKSLAVLKQ